MTKYLDQEGGAKCNDCGKYKLTTEGLEDCANCGEFVCKSCKRYCRQGPIYGNLCKKCQKLVQQKQVMDMNKNQILEKEKQKYEAFIARNAERSLGEVKGELRELINEIISTTWHAAGEKMRSDLLDEIG